jgi:hypothetical protein
MAENTEFQNVIDKAKELETIDFKNGDLQFDYNVYYEAIEKISNKNNNLKQEEAENVVGEFAVKFVDESFVEELNKKRESIKDYIRKYDPNSEIIKDMKVHDVDKVYVIFNYLLNSYIQYLNQMAFNLELTKEEFKFLNKVLTQTIEYDGDEVFNYTEFIESFWDSAKEEVEKDKSKESYVFKIDIKKILLLHHLIKGHKVKGITNEFRQFRSILYKIAQTNRIFNAYNIIVDRLKEDAKLWGSALDIVLEPKEISEGLEKPVDTQNGLHGVTVTPVTKEDLGEIKI